MTVDFQADRGPRSGCGTAWLRQRAWSGAGEATTMTARSVHRAHWLHMAATSCRARPAHETSSSDQPDGEGPCARATGSRWHRRVVSGAGRRDGRHPRARGDRGRPALHLPVRRRGVAARALLPLFSRSGTRVPRSRSVAEPSGTPHHPGRQPRPGRSRQRPVLHQSDGSSTRTHAGQGTGNHRPGRGHHPGRRSPPHLFSRDRPPGAHPEFSWSRLEVCRNR